MGKFMISAMKKDIAAAILIEHDSSVKDALVLTQKQLSEKWPVPHSLRLCLRDEWASSEARPFSSCQADPHPGGADLVVRLGDNRLSIYAVSRVPHSSRLCLVR